MKVKLGEVCIFQRGQTITKKDIINGDVPVVAGGQTPAYYHNKANREKNIITISSSGYAGYVNFWTVPIFCSDSFTVKPKDDNQFIIRYLYFFLKSRQEYIYSLSRGCGIKHIYSSDIAPFEIELVDIQTQKEIVSVLDRVTSLISKRKKQLEKLDILVKSKFIEMFGDNVIASQYSIKISDIALKIGDGLHGTPNYDETGIYAFINGIYFFSESEAAVQTLIDNSYDASYVEYWFKQFIDIYNNDNVCSYYLYDPGNYHPSLNDDKNPFGSIDNLKLTHALTIFNLKKYAKNYKAIIYKKSNIEEVINEIIN